MQVENRAGLAALDEILTVDGVDGVFIGPADLAADMGHRGNPGAPAVQGAIKGAITRIHMAGKAPGILAMDKGFIHECLDLGATFVAVGIDVTLFAQAMRSLAAQYKQD